MIFLKTDDEIELLRQSNLLVGRTLAEVAKMIQPGVTTKQLDKVAEEFIRDHGAIPTFKGFPNPYGSPFPGTLCTSVNDQVVHGIPNDIPLKDGDIVSVDCGTFMNGFCGDSAYTFCVGEVDPEIVKLLKVTKESLYKGIENAVHGKRLGDIGYSIQEYCEAHSYGVVREFVGHGIGKEMHEDPPVPNYGRRGTGTLLKKGMCIAIEPMITMGNRQIVMEEDRWTIRTRDRKCAAHFEHTVAGIWSIRAKSTIARPAAERQSQQFGQFRQSISERTADPTLLRRSIRQPKPEPEWLLLRELHHRPTVRTARRTAEQPTRNRQLAADQPVQTCGGMAAEEGEERDPRHLRNTWHRRHHPRPGTTDLARCHAEGRRDRTRRILRGFRRGPHCDRNRGTRTSGRMARA